MLAIYTRLSKEDEASNSIKNQLNEGKSFAESNLLEYKIYNEGEGISGGASVIDRPKLKQLIQDINQGSINKVWFRNQNRLERHQITFHFFVDIVRKKKIEVYFGDKLADYSDASTYLQGSILSSINTYQRELQSQQTKTSLHNNVAQGKVQGMIPYGYSKGADSMLTINENEAEVIRKIFELSLNGLGLEKIRDRLNELEIPTRYNSYGKGSTRNVNKYSGFIRNIKKKDVKWSHSSISSIIKNKIYKGVRLYGGVEYKSPVIIEPAHWDSVNKNLKANRLNSGKSTAHKYLLKGLLRCDRCHRNYYGKTRINGNYNYYVCSSQRYREIRCGNSSISLEVLDELIWTKFIGDGRLLKVISKYIEDNNNTEIVDALKENLKALKTLLNTVKTSVSKLIDLAVKGVLSDDDIKSKMSQFNQEKADLELKILNAEETLKMSASLEDNADSYLAELRTSRELNFNSKQAILKKYIKDISIETSGDYFLISISFNVESIDRVEYVLFKHYKYAHSFPLTDKNEIIVLDDNLLNEDYDFKILLNKKEVELITAYL